MGLIDCYLETFIEKEGGEMKPVREPIELYPWMEVHPSWQLRLRQFIYASDIPIWFIGVMVGCVALAVIGVKIILWSIE